MESKVIIDFMEFSKLLRTNEMSFTSALSKTTEFYDGIYLEAKSSRLGGDLFIKSVLHYLMCNYMKTQHDYRERSVFISNQLGDVSYVVNNLIKNINANTI